MDLEKRFKQLAQQYSEDSKSIETLWKTLNMHYSEPHRANHNLTHLRELFGYYDTYKNELGQPNMVAFAIFYHDIIYNIWKKDNEELSAEFALQVLQDFALSKNDLQQICKYIIATKTHEADTNDGKWMIDFDLAILGKSQEIYMNYAQLIRKEYKLVPWFLYKKGRKKVLQHFIDKPFIYATETFRNNFESQAKQNLSHELNSI